jgi:hypothetical protein
VAVQCGPMDRPRLRHWDAYDYGLTAETIHETQAEPKWSGLYDAEGRKLYHPPNPVGFLNEQIDEINTKRASTSEPP